MVGFNYVVLNELTRQLRRGPAHLRTQEINRAEQFLAKLDPAKEYPYEFVYHLITDTQLPQSRRMARPLLLEGKKLLADLTTLILELSDSLEMPRAVFPQGTIALEDLTRELAVSAKTVSRWRRRGLTARKAVFPDGRRRLVFLPESLRLFTAEHQQMLSRAARFQRLTARQRGDIIERARALYQQGTPSPYQVCVQLAQQEGRAVETVRSILRGHDRLHPAQAVFPSASAPLSPKQKNSLFEAFTGRVPLAELARRFRRSRSSIYRLVNEIRSERLKAKPIEYVYNPEFDLPGFADHIAPPARPGRLRRPWRLPADELPTDESLPEYLRLLGEEPLLDPEDELQLFRQYNYLKFRADLLRGELGPYQNLSPLVQQIETLLYQAEQLKNQIIAANLRLVVNIAKRHIGPHAELFELVSDGNISLIRAVEKFDYCRRYRFSTYATWAISRDYAKTVPQADDQFEHYITGQAAMLDVAADGRGDGQLLKPEILAQRDLLDEILQMLEPRERHIIAAHFGLGNREKPESLDAIGKSLGLTKERTRQIESQALRKLRRLLSPQQPQGG